MPALSRSAPLVFVLGAALAGCNGLYQPAATSPSGPPKGLAVGDVAPEIEGEDADGKHFKLSDYRGKVILLSFWHST